MSEERTVCRHGHAGFMKQSLHYYENRPRPYMTWRCMECSRLCKVRTAQRLRKEQPHEDKRLAKAIKEICLHGHVGSMGRRFEYDRRQEKYYLKWYCRECVRLRSQAQRERTKAT